MHFPCMTHPGAWTSPCMAHPGAQAVVLQHSGPTRPQPPSHPSASPDAATRRRRAGMAQPRRTVTVPSACPVISVHVHPPSPTATPASPPQRSVASRPSLPPAPAATPASQRPALSGQLLQLASSTSPDLSSPAGTPCFPSQFRPATKHPCRCNASAKASFGPHGTPRRRRAPN